jgi:mRNA interferase RelE/StbE
MTYKLDFLEEALAEWNKLNPSIKQPLKKKLIKVLENPRIPKNKLSGHPNRYKIKLRSIGYRLVYEVVDGVVVIVIAVGRRENNAVYDDANSSFINDVMPISR